MQNKRKRVTPTISRGKENMYCSSPSFATKGHEELCWELPRHAHGKTPNFHSVRACRPVWAAVVVHGHEGSHDNGTRLSRSS